MAATPLVAAVVGMAERLTPEEARRLLAKSAGEQPETAIRRQVAQYLRTLGWDVTYHMAGPLSRKGYPDLTALRDGRVVFIEVKTAKGRLSGHQQAVREAIEGHGGEYRVVRCLEDVADLGRWG